MISREILFRGKRVDNDEWLYGYYSQTNDYLDDKKIHLIFTTNSTAYPDNEIAGVDEINPETLGQYTGLADKNNIKIFENDIICFQNQYYVVHWNEESFQWQAHIAVGEWTSSAFDGILDTGAVNNVTLGWIAAEIPIIGKMTTEVVGNVYDNPELICEKKEGGVIFCDRF